MVFLIISACPDLRRMQQVTRTQLKNIVSEHERITSYLEAQKKELEDREAELHKREALNEKERQKLDFQKKLVLIKVNVSFEMHKFTISMLSSSLFSQNERASLEQKRADEKVLKLAEEHKVLFLYDSKVSKPVTILLNINSVLNFAEGKRETAHANY